MRSESQRRADAAYRKKNAAKIAAAEKIVAAHIPRETAEKFQAACSANGTTPNAVLKAAIEKYIMEDTANEV